MAAPPVLPDDLIEEILLRLPPDDPASLLRASAVCQTWGSVVSRPSFRRRIHELHRTPPVLGFLDDWYDEHVPDFFPTTATAFSYAAPDRRVWWALDCRHGRALFISKARGGAPELLVWEPVTGRQRRVSVPAAFGRSYLNAAVFCAADACDHRDCQCHGGPFRVAFVFAGDTDDLERIGVLACVYSSDTSTWGEVTSTHGEFCMDGTYYLGRCHFMDFTYYSSVLAGRSLLYFISDDALIVEYDLARNELTVIDTPETENESKFVLMLAEDGGLGLIQDLDSHLQLWSMQRNDRTDARWILSQIIDLHIFLPVDALVNAECSLFVLGFAEGANVIFVNTDAGLFTIELLSKRARKVCGSNGFLQVVPVVGFYTPVSRNRNQGLPLSNARVEERGEEEEKTGDQAQQLFDNQPNAIKEGTLLTSSNVSAMSSDLDDSGKYVIPCSSTP
ncbi:unnamed protein product [Alopecurus aequalis]